MIQNMTIQARENSLLAIISQQTIIITSPVSIVTAPTYNHSILNILLKTMRLCKRKSEKREKNFNLLVI